MSTHRLISRPNQRPPPPPTTPAPNTHKHEPVQALLLTDPGDLQSFTHRAAHRPTQCQLLADLLRADNQTLNKAWLGAEDQERRGGDTGCLRASGLWAAPSGRHLESLRTAHCSSLNRPPECQPRVKTKNPNTIFLNICMFVMTFYLFLTIRIYEYDRVSNLYYLSCIECWSVVKIV